MSERTRTQKAAELRWVDVLFPVCVCVAEVRLCTYQQSKVKSKPQTPNPGPAHAFFSSRIDGEMMFSRARHHAQKWGHGPDSQLYETIFCVLAMTNQHSFPIFFHISKTVD